MKIITESHYTYFTGFDTLLSHLDVRHFAAYELCRVGVTRSNVTLQAPPPSLWANMIPTILRLETVRRELGGRLRINSGYRDPAYNKAVGGSTNSLHMAFNAVDVVPLDTTVHKLYEALIALPNAATYCGVIRYANNGFVHFDTRGLISDAMAYININS